ncbi:hypothetical protein [Paenibacillus lutimineralis]|uniref:Phage tail tape measure protein n=1 Tax=Paenibacillus lutimineralis TaxID=2707005 RepID=A0A3Q9I963_9BACL|nr:hypothetical protein [Paenibacillus lutimineralis]AZS15368.1 hypothetical protein EI981_13435 [Paenibacillus lutimineralis]
MADNKEFYRLDLVIGTSGAEEAERTVRALDKLLEQTERRTAALGKTKIAPEVILTDKTSTPAKKVISKLAEVDQTVANPEVVLADKTATPAKKVISKLATLDTTQANPEVDLVDKTASPASKIKSRVERINQTKAKPEAKLVDKVSGAANKVSSTLSAMARKPYNIVVRVKDMATGVIKKITSALTSPLAMLGVGGGVAGVTTVGLDMVMQEQGITSAFKVMLGSAEAAAQRVQELTAFAGKTPYKREEIYEASRVLQVFTGNALSTGEGLKMVGDIAAGTKQEFGDVALWVGRLYDALKSGRPVGEMTSRLQEMGAIGGDARAGIEALAESGLKIDKTWPLVTQAFGKFDGMMEDMSGNLQNLLLGTKSFFTQNVVKRWGYGIESALGPALKKFREWRGENKETIASIGEWFEAAGKNVSTFVLDKGQRAFKILTDLANDPAFQNADFFGKVKIAWDKIITEPLGEWLASEGANKLTEMASKIGDILGGGAHGLIMGGLEVLSPSGDEIVNENPYVEAGKRAGKAFFSSFIEALDPGEILKRLGEAGLNINKDAFTDPSWGNTIKAGVFDVMAIAGISSVVGWFVKNFGWLGKLLPSGTRVAATTAAAGTAASTVASTATAATAAETAAGALGLSALTIYGGSALLAAGGGIVAGEAMNQGLDKVTELREQNTLRKESIASNLPKPEETTDWAWVDNDKPKWYDFKKKFWNWVANTEIAGVDMTDIFGQPESLTKQPTISEFANSEFNKFPDVYKPVQTYDKDLLPNLQAFPTATNEPQPIQIPEEQIAQIVNPLNELKQQIEVNITMSPGLVNMNVTKEEVLPVEEVVSQVGHKVRMAMLNAEINLK